MIQITKVLLFYFQQNNMIGWIYSDTKDFRLGFMSDLSMWWRNMKR